MFESRHRSGGGSSANRWLIVAGAGLVILAFVARMLLDIGQTKVSDLAGVLRPDTANATAAATTPQEPPPVPVTVVTDSSATDTTAPPPPDTTPAPPLPGDRYVVQIGAFGSEANATKLTQRALAIGYEATVIPQVRGNATLYLVRVARAGSPADARIASDSLARTLGVNAVVLRPGQ